MPPGKLLVDYPRGISIRPNDTVTTGLLWTRPRLWWRTRPGSLYTVIIVDTGIAALQGAQYFHWAVVNIPELDLGAGAEVMEYIPPFQVQLIDKLGLHNICKKKHCRHQNRTLPTQCWLLSTSNPVRSS